MFRVPSFIILFGLMFCGFASGKPKAQPFDETGIVYEAARNKIGVILYCRQKALLDPAKAARAITAVEIGLRNFPIDDVLAEERGDRAQQAGENGFWEEGSKRDIASIATLFRTTPADLCKEWADETLRAQEPMRPMQVNTAASLGRAAPLRPLARIAPAAAGPTINVIQPAPAPGATRAAVAGSRPLLAGAPPFLPARANPGAPRTALTDSRRAVAGQVSRTTLAAPSSRQVSAQAVPISARRSYPAGIPSRGGQAVNTWRWRMTGYRDCWMPGCRWPTPQEWRARRY